MTILKQWKGSRVDILEVVSNASNKIVDDIKLVVKVQKVLEGPLFILW